MAGASVLPLGHTSLQATSGRPDGELACVAPLGEGLLG